MGDTTSRNFRINRSTHNNGQVINDRVDFVKTSQETELVKFTVGFHYYREDICPINSMDKSPLRKIIENSKKLCKCTTELDMRQVGFEISTVDDSNHYQEYYKGLEDGVELKEYDIGNSGRAFFFIDKSNNRKVIQMVALKNGHTETKKRKKQFSKNKGNRWAKNYS